MKDHIEVGYVADKNTPNPGETPYMEHFHGVPWHEAALPRRWHKCFPQTVGWVGYYGLTPVHRCACGATRTNPGFLADTGWQSKNERRRQVK